MSVSSLIAEAADELFREFQSQDGSVAAPLFDPGVEEALQLAAVSYVNSLVQGQLGRSLVALIRVTR